MKGYVKYFILFIILILIGVVSINFYNNSKLDNDFKKTKETNNNKENKNKKENKNENSNDTTKKEENKSNNSSNNSVNNNNNTNSNTTNNNNTNNNSNSNSTTNNNSTINNNNNNTTNNNSNDSNPNKDQIETSKGYINNSNNNTTSNNTTSSNTNNTSKSSTNNNKTSNNTTPSSSSTTTNNNSVKSNTNNNTTNKNTTPSSSKDEYITIRIDNSVYDDSTSQKNTSKKTNSSNNVVVKEETTKKENSNNTNNVKKVKNANIKANKIEFNKSKLKIQKGKKAKFSYTITPTDTTDKTVKYTYDKEYIKVYKSGKIKALKEGTTYLKITTANGLTDKMKITITDEVTDADIDAVKEAAKDAIKEGPKVSEEEINDNVVVSEEVQASSINFANTKLNLKVNEVGRFSYTINPTDTTDKTVKYSFDSDYIKVYKSGKIKALKAGTTYLKITTTNGLTDKMKIVISEDDTNNVVVSEEVQASSINFANTKLNLKVNEVGRFSYTINPTDTTDKTVKYSFDSDYIKVYKSGKIKALKAGTTYLKITTTNGLTDKMKIVISEEDTNNNVVDSEEVQVENIEFDKDILKFNVGEVTKFSYTIKPSNTTDKTVKYSYDKEYIKVYKSGKIKALKAGTTYLKVIASNGLTDKMKIVISEKKTKAIKDGNIIGATGYSATRNSKLYLYKSPNTSSTKLNRVTPGVPFKILAETGNNIWWKVDYAGTIGYVRNAYCLINLPDYIPSITYNITNASGSIYTSSGVKLSVYGKQLYKKGKVYNERLDRDEYIVPVVYSFAKKILKAQKHALNEGYSLKIYDAYRPKGVADDVKYSLDRLYNNNSKVKKNINKGGWGRNWFIAQNLSAHSVASAIDVTLTKKGSTKSLNGPSRMHELSVKAVKYKTPVSGQTSVRSDLYSRNMNKMAKDLDRIMVNVGMTNLASEWWHFQDNTAKNRIKAIEPNGLNFHPTKIVSSK